MLGSGKQDLLFTVRGMLIPEMFIVPVLFLMDFDGILSKYIFAPRAKTRYQMLFMILLRDTRMLRILYCYVAFIVHYFLRY